MSTTGKTTGSGCDGRCSCCAAGALLLERAGGPRGRRLVFMSLLVFVAPWVVVALVGAAFPEHRHAQVVAVWGSIIFVLAALPRAFRRLFNSQGETS